MQRKRTSAKSQKASTNTRRDAALARVTQSAKSGELVAVVGTGVSSALTMSRVPAVSWRGLIQSGYQFGQERGRITNAQARAWKAQLRSDDLDDLLGAAEFMSRKLDAPNGDLYARWLEDALSSAQSCNVQLEKALKAMHTSGIPICTLNYDTLLEQVLGLPTIDFSDAVSVAAWVRREQAGVLHVHGVWSKPSTCILGIRDYSIALLDDVRELIQRTLGSFRRLLFVGCGDTFADPNFGALISWLRSRMKAAAPQHYALVTDDQVDVRRKDVSWQGFVEPLAYGRAHGDLPNYLLECIAVGGVASPRAVRNGSPREMEANRHAAVVASYRTFLLRDCGQMTIEGVRADMDMAQRFDIERLFVPLRVLACQDDSNNARKTRESKVVSSDGASKEPFNFGQAFLKHKKMALLALPGGGKTLLLKRLAVAYSDDSRRKASNDGLPSLRITPLLIRCREWREHIHLPIPTILRKIPEITGQASLEGLFEAVSPLLRKGSILLLVDGLDEIHDDGARTTFVDNLESFLGDYPSVRLVVTSREAGFGLVAPSINRFCERLRIAPLDSRTIITLCEHWHRLMSGGTPEAMQDSADVSSALLRNPALRRLAENPLLLTMLLVVKHGAGRLPPDRVSLYERAVEVLLDTWNIKGHEALNVKEAVPQLAYVAFRLMQDGKQTATEKELLALLDEAREKVPQIRRYARGTSFEFLKRVELRSSLVLEAGHQLEGGRAVPFYQFRHLTFQEYLAAVAAAEGHYLGYASSDSVLSPLQAVLTSDEWKEVIPMAAVLAGKQAAALVQALVTAASVSDATLEKEELHPGQKSAAIARLAACLVEEAEVAPEMLNRVLHLIVLADQGIAMDELGLLARGPYGTEMLHQAWKLFSGMAWTSSGRHPANFMHLAAQRSSRKYWSSPEGVRELKRLLQSTTVEEVVLGLMTMAGFAWGGAQRDQLPLQEYLKIVDGRQIFRPEPAVYAAAAWERGWFALWNVRSRPDVSIGLLDRVLDLWKKEENACATSALQFCLCMHLGLPKRTWQPRFTESEVHRVLRARELEPAFDSAVNLGFTIMLAFHSGQVWSDKDLAHALDTFRSTDLGRYLSERLDSMQISLGMGRGSRRGGRPRKRA